MGRRVYEGLCTNVDGLVEKVFPEDKARYRDKSSGQG